MPNILLKNEIGEDIAYNDVDTVTLRRVEGGTATYTFQRPNATDEWKMVEGVVSGDSRTTMFSKSTLSVPSGKIVMYTEPSFGTWYQSRYDAWRISTLQLNQMYAVPGGAILSINSTGNKIFFWDDDEKELVELAANASPIYNFRKYGDKYFIATYRYWYLYDPETHELTELATGYSMSAYCLDTGEELLLSVANNNSQNPKGIWRLDPETYELTQLYDQGWYWMGGFRTYEGTTQSTQYLVELDDGYLICSNSSYYGVLKFNKTTKAVTQLVNTGYYYFTEGLSTRYSYSTWTRIIPGYGVVFCSSQSTAWGVWYYDFDTGEVTQVMETGYINYWVENDDLVFGSYSSYGVLVFDKATKRWYHPVTTGVFDIVLKCENGLLIGPQSSSYGIRYYDFTTEEVTTISTSYNYWRYGVSVDGGALLSCETSGTGVWFFDEAEKTFTQLNTNGYAWYMVKWHDSVLMGSFGSAYGYHFYKDGELTYVSMTGSGNRYLHCIVPVDDGWLMGSWNNSGMIRFVDGETGVATDLGFSFSQMGPYAGYWYGHNGIWKPNYDYNRKYGRYRVISSYDSQGFIFDDVTHEAIPMTYWYTGSESPSVGSTVKYTSMRRVSFVEYGNSCVLIIPGSSSNNGVIFFNYASGEAYLFNGVSLYANNDTNYWFTPLTALVPVGNGYLIFVKPFDWDKYPTTMVSATGVWHLNTGSNRLQRIYTSGYYDSTEDAPGGFYLYLSSLPVECRLYWNSDSNTISKVNY